MVKGQCESKCRPHRYSGSQATPPCTEGVKFRNFSEPITMSAKRIDVFMKACDGNNRPVLLPWLLMWCRVKGFR
ncbi:MAG: carbonic anhydrase family protein [Candidatus Nanopelagicales bacterium]